MKLIDVSCPKCRSTMKVDKKNKEVKCEYCGHIFLIDDEVVKVLHIQNGEITEEQEFRNAETNLNNFKDYTKAYNLYYKLSEKYADNPEIWIGLLRCVSCDFTKKSYDPIYEEYWNRFESLASKKDINEWKEKYDNYINSFNGYDKIEAKGKDDKDYIYATIFGGWFGLHKFLKKQTGMGILYLFTTGLFGIGWIIDIIKEIKDHPAQKQKLYNCLGVFAILLGLAYTDYSIIGALMMIASGIMTFKKITMLIWKNPVSYSKWIKIGLFALGFIISAESAPGYIGTWYYCLNYSCSSVAEVNISSTTVEEKIGDQNRSYTSAVQESDKDYIISYGEAKLKYDKNDKKFCFLIESECTTYLYNDRALLPVPTQDSEDNQN